MTESRWRWALAAWWLAAFAATHTPIPPLPPGPDVLLKADKLVHFAIYAGIAFMAVKAGLGDRLGRWGLAGLLLAFAVFDELSQIPVGRHAHFYDWVADAAGVAAGLVAAAWSERAS